MLVKNMANDLSNIYPRSYQSVLDTFFENIGDADITETDDLEAADAFFIMASMGQSYFHSKIADFEYITLQENLERLEFANRLLEKPVLIMMDTHGPSAPKDYDIDLGMLKETDIPVGWASLPAGHPNTQECVGIVSTTQFRLIRRYERTSKSLMIIADAFNFIADEMHEILPLFDSVFVSNTHILPEAFEGYDNISCAGLGSRDEIWKALLQTEYVLSTRPEMGLEMMGVEGGFCGARPIYPDTPFYRDIFLRCEGVAFFDSDNIVESLKAVLDQPNTWIEDFHSDFVRDFSAEHSIPDFWENVVKILSAKG